jgi:hypothetical protein
MAAEFIGVDAINLNLEKFNFDALGVYDKKLEKFKRIISEGESEDDLILAFNDWCERMLASNPMNFKTYSLQLYDMPEGAKKLKGTISFTFALKEPITQLKTDKPMQPNGEYITKKELELALANQRLEFENSLLQKRLEDIELLEDDEDEDEQPSVAGAMQEALIGKLPQLIDLAMLSFAGKKQQPVAMAGIDETIDIINEFKEINPEIENDLKKLLNLAKTNPALFNMLISQLRTM